MNQQLNNLLREGAIDRDDQFLYLKPTRKDLSSYSFVYRMGVCSALYELIYHHYDGRVTFYCSNQRNKSFLKKYERQH